tara:strand:- start:1258 stop:2322 length:1065 start_codon:yes stop_codon:yes gene_type:complete
MRLIWYDKDRKVISREEGNKINIILDEEIEKYIVAKNQIIQRHTNYAPKFIRNLDDAFENKNMIYTSKHSDWYKNKLEELLNEIKDKSLKDTMDSIDGIEALKKSIGYEEISDDFKIKDVEDKNKVNKELELFGGLDNTPIKINDIIESIVFEDKKPHQLEDGNFSVVIDAKLESTSDGDIKIKRYDNTGIKIEVVDYKGKQPESKDLIQLDKEKPYVKDIISIEEDKTFEEIVNDWIDENKFVFVLEIMQDNDSTNYIVNPLLLNEFKFKLEIIHDGKEIKEFRVFDIRHKVNHEIRENVGETTDAGSAAVKRRNKEENEKIMMFRADYFKFINARLEKIERVLNKIPKGIED